MGNNSIIQSDPMLDQNNQITGASPAAGQGIAVAGGLPADYNGNAYSEPPAIGAFTSQN